MINLLPPDVRQSYGYARRNQYLRKWISGMLCGLAGIVLIVLGGLLYINHTITDFTAQKAAAEAQLKVQKLEDTQSQLENISANLKLVTQVLSQQVLFSQLMQQIGRAMPPDAVLTDLNIGKLSGGLDIKAATTTQAVGTQVQVNLQDPANKIFDKVDIVSLTCTDTRYGGKYPCTVQLRASFLTCNPFLFVNTNSACTAPKTGGAQ